MENLNFFTWESLGTIVGASLLTFLVVQLAKKPLDGLCHLMNFHFPTDIFAAIVGASVLYGSGLALGTITDPKAPLSIALCLINGIIVSSVAGQMYNKVITPPSSFGRSPEPPEPPEPPVV